MDHSVSKNIILFFIIIIMIVIQKIIRVILNLKDGARQKK